LAPAAPAPAACYAAPASAFFFSRRSSSFLFFETRPIGMPSALSPGPLLIPFGPLI
jgi:hypothetical protein